jgi:predicted nucleotidyltransferase
MSSSKAEKTLRLERVALSLDVQYILEHAYVRPGDVVFVSGTLVEGIGNKFSDIDVYVITDAYRSSRTIDLGKHHRVLSRERDIIRPDTPEKEVFLIQTVVPGTSIKVDVEYKTLSELEALFGRIHEIFLYATRNLKLLTKRLSDLEEVLIHRLFHAFVLQNHERFAELVSKVSEDEFLYLAYRWIATDFNILLDLAGAWHAGELDRAVELARENVIIQTSAFLRLRGVTNLRRKWLLTYFDRLEDDRVYREAFLDLLYLRGVSDDRRKAEYVLKTFDFVDELQSRSRPYLERLGRVPSGDAALSLLEADRSAFRSPYADWEHEHRLAAYRERSTPTRVRFTELAGERPGG